MPKDRSSADNNNVSNVSDNDAEHRVLEFLPQESTVTGRGMAAELETSDRQVWRILKKLRENGTIIRIDSTRIRVKAKINSISLFEFSKSHKFETDRQIFIL